MILLVVTGQIDFPEKQRETWRNLRLSTANYQDWPDGAPLFTGESPRTHATVGDVLDAAARLSGRPGFFEYDGHTIRALLPPEATAALHQDLATALRLLETVGGKGRVSFFVPQENVAFVMGIGEKLGNVDSCCGCHDEEVASEGCGCQKNKGDKGCGCQKNKGDEGCGCQKNKGDEGCGCHDEDCDENCDCQDEDQFVSWANAQSVFDADETSSFGFVRVMDFFNAWSSDNSLSRSAYLARRAGLGLLPLDQQPHHAELLTLVRGLDIGALHAAMLKAETKDGEQVTLERRYPTAEALRQALAKPEPVARAAAIELLSLMQPEQVEARVEPLLEDPSTDVRRHALVALSHVPTDTALARALALDPLDHRGDVLYSTTIMRVVASSQAPGAEALVAAQLDSDSLQANQWLPLKRGCEQRETLATRAAHAIELSAIRPTKGVVTKLCTLFDTHPAEEIRIAAAKALARTGGQEVEARTEVITCTLLNMGKALNLDDERRRAILGVSGKDYASDLIRFSGVDHATLSTLLEERFADMESTQNDALSIGEFLELLEEHPELRVGGYLIAPTRNDYRVSVDQITCPKLNDVPEERRDDVEELFATLSESATNTEAGPGELNCWWT